MSDLRRPRVSIIIPAYNASATLPLLIRSLRRQTMAEWEAVIADDDSTDCTLAVATELAAADPRLKVVRVPPAPAASARADNPHRHYGTPFNTRRVAARHAEAPFVCCIDADDYVEDDYLDKLLRRARETGADMVLSTLCLRSGDLGECARTIPPAGFDMSLHVPGRSLMGCTLYEWQLSFNGALVATRLFSEVSDEEHGDVTNPAYDELAARVMLARAEMCAFSDARYFYVASANSLMGCNSPARFTYPALAPDIDRFVCDEYGVDSPEGRLAALHRFAVWMDARHNLREVPVTPSGANRRRVDESLLSLPMGRLWRLLSPRYLIIVGVCRLQARWRRRFRRASRQR